MAGDSERRFEKIMSKLSHPRPPNPTTSDGIGKKRFESGLRVSATNSTGLVPPCRPWDRGDLMRRLATFKAMTWFGKPQVVNPVNCARRGWINVEMDIIACVACGARLLFSTPSSWNLQQVEKAAAVFSLKLENGHKLLCPWNDNACDEALALFPPTPPPLLVDGYGERAAALLGLTALPVVSFSAIDYMRSPQLEQFLSQSSHTLVCLNKGISLTDNPRNKDILGASEDATANKYYQAQKIISLCGWKPRLLPYVVDSKPSTSSAGIPTAQKDSTILYTSSGSSECEGRNNNLLSLGEHLWDPASVVFDCTFCGACVGLWAFATVQRPLESFTLVADSNNQNGSNTRCASLISGTEAPKGESLSKGHQNLEGGCDSGYIIGSMSKERPLGLSLTIAGGPPPTKQNFRPVVSFPIISRHLRSDVASSFGTGYASSNASCEDQLNAQSYSQINVQSGKHADADGGSGVSLEGSGFLKRKRSDIELHVSESNDVNDSSRLEGEVYTSENGPNFVDKNSINPYKGRKNDPEGTQTLHSDVDDIVNSKENRVRDLQRDPNSEDVREKPLHSESAISKSVEVEQSIFASSNTIARVDSSKPDGTCEYNEVGPSNIASCSSTPHRGDRGSDILNLNDAKTTDRMANAVESMVFASAGRNENVNHAMGDNLQPPMQHKISEFDPIRQHRPFCPWIAPVDGKHLPGWKSTLSALVQQEKDSSSDPLGLDSAPTLLDEVDDPIISIRKLFSSPPSKRLKGAR
ncbi:Uncharacterized protein M6B38_218625 [Iris pallida]|uniref:C3HC-type domain-containing protein n=1 Tax=Iris pallida TaxID=29817 RepID=A0AAX6DXG3_IRIPA|nr:Uncharacterized protein M6B38_218625 [Iris pallida]